jgi:hypothetical protein
LKHTNTTSSNKKKKNESRKIPPEEEKEIRGNTDGKFYKVNYEEEEKRVM